jgi:hypothetical protein
MENKTPKFNIVYKGVKERPSETERKTLDLSTAKITETSEVVFKVMGTKYTLGDDSNESIGTMYLWENDPVVEDSVKLKQIMLEHEYQGGGAVYALYDKALEVAQGLHKNLVLDCKAGLAAFKSFEKFAEKKSLKLIKNDLNVFNESLNRWEAPDNEWTLKIIT